VSSPTFDRWVEERCLLGARFRATSPDDLYADYADWMPRTGELTAPLRVFEAMINGCPGVKRSQLRSGRRIFRGIALKAVYDQLGQWIAERCERGPKLCQASCDLWPDFLDWIEARGENAPSERVFVSRLREVEGLSYSERLPEGLPGFWGIAVRVTGLAERRVRRGYRQGDECGPLFYVLMIDGKLPVRQIAVEIGMVSLTAAERIVRKMGASANYERWCRSVVQRIFAGSMRGEDAGEIASGLPVPKGWPLIPRHVVERIGERLAVAKNASPLFYLREELRANPANLALGNDAETEKLGTEIEQEVSGRKYGTG
jgi:hypothetical protein